MPVADVLFQRSRAASAGLGSMGTSCTQASVGRGVRSNLALLMSCKVGISFDTATHSQFFLSRCFPMPFTINSPFSVSHEVRGFYKGVTASVLAVSVVSSVSFGTYKNSLSAICKLRYGAVDAKPSKLDVSLAGAAAGAARVGKQPTGKAQQEILFTNIGGWKSRECILGPRGHRGACNKSAGFVFAGEVMLCPCWLAPWRGRVLLGS